MKKIFLYEGHTGTSLYKILSESPIFSDVEIVSSQNHSLSFVNLGDLFRDFGLSFVRLHIRPPNGVLSSAIRQFFNVREWFNLMLSASETLDDRMFVNHPIKALIAESKPLQLETASSCGLECPKHLFTNDPESQIEFIRAAPQGCVAKPIDNSVMTNPDNPSDTLLIFTRRISEEDIRSDVVSRNNGESDPPFIIQEEIQKAFELRIVIYGHDCRNIKIDSQRFDNAKIDFRWQLGTPDIYSMIEDEWGLFKPCREYLDNLGLDTGVFDFAIQPDGTPVFFECNPNGQWAGMNAYANGDIQDMACRYFKMRLENNLQDFN